MQKPTIVAGMSKFAILFAVMQGTAYAATSVTFHGNLDELPICGTEEGPECRIVLAHGTDLPPANLDVEPLYCGDEDADPQNCIAWDGDISLGPVGGPYRVCDDGREIDGFNCYSGSREDLPATGAELAELSFHENGSRDAIAIVRSESEPVVEERRIGARSWCSYGGPWWCKNHSQHPGQDEDRPGASQDRDTARAEPAPVDPPSDGGGNDRSNRSEPSNPCVN